MSIDDKCLHEPQRVYWWKDLPCPEGREPYFATCKYCKTDYQITLKQYVDCKIIEHSVQEELIK
jgi:hypothetical protein